MSSSVAITKPKKPAAQRLARELARIPDVAGPGAIDTVEQLWLDTLGVALAASDLPLARALASRCHPGDPVSGSILIGYGFAHDWESALLANGAMAHALDFDDYQQPPACMHVSAVLVPALLAASTLAGGASGASVLRGHLAGLAAAVCVGSWVNPEHFLRGWHPTGTVGTLSAAAAASSVLDLNVESTARALGIAASFASGLGQNIGSDVKPLHAGQAARNGVLAAQLARSGITPDTHALDGDRGFGRLMANTRIFDVPDIDGLLEQAFGGLAIKRFASCGATHCAMEAALQVREQLGGIGSDNVGRIVVEINPRSLGVLSKHKPVTGTEAKFSLEHSVAVVLARGRGGIEEFTDDVVNDEAVEKLARKIEIVADGDAPETLEWPARVAVHPRDGSPPLEAHVLSPSGRWPDRRLTWTELMEKFEQCTARVMTAERAQVIEQMVRSLETQPCVSRLSRLLALPGRSIMPPRLGSMAG